VIAIVLAALLSIPAQDASARERPWPEVVLETASAMAVQDGGRIKPVSTFAQFTLLRLSGRRSLQSFRGEELTPVAWLLDVLFFPEDAAREKLFLVQDSDAVAAIGLDVGEHRKRDRWSYAELQPALPRLFDLAHEYDAIPEKERGSVQQQVVLLAGNVMAFLRLAREFDPVAPEVQGAANMFDTGLLAWIPPELPPSQTEAWRTVAELARVGSPSESDQALLRSLRALAAEREGPAFERELTSFAAKLAARAEARGEAGKIALERSYYDSHVLGWSLGAFLASLLVASLLWLRPASRRIHAALFALVAAGVALLVAAIVVRCMIRGRPPVSTLYESVLFVTAVGGLLALGLEALHRNRIAVSAASVLGCIGLFVANGYETLDKQDTMPSLVAVLDTNFWLATHVTAITIGYSAGLLAALLASLYLLAKLLGFRRSDPGFRRSLARMTYGVVCFAVIFSIVGTILGGIWANESWGRFWGWDPKENGALLIVISQIAILHGRLSGALREHGLCAAAAFGGTVIAFSWWGVNLLGVGLHSYGFTSGVHTALWTYYGLQWGIVALGGAAWWRERAVLRAGAPIQSMERGASQAPRIRRPNRTQAGQAA